MLTRRGIDTRGHRARAGAELSLDGRVSGNLNEAQTLGTDLNVFETFEPKIPEAYKDSEYLFLANIDPVLQARVRSQMPKVRMVCGDTMNYWIADHAANLAKVLRELDVLLINDGEARMLSGETNSVQAAEKVLAMGPKTLVVKHGEYGATAFFSERSFRGAQTCRGRSARRRCRWLRWWIRPARAIRLPADSTATLRRSRS